ncbi:MAG: autotransporter-associated beta strand repeat-containing protein [Verrucomicrobia bacterium]|nr:autotransporter-associated beta strand repeat-containing protein [Verrucomicrobiota bacterium]
MASFTRFASLAAAGFLFGPGWLPAQNIVVNRYDDTAPGTGGVPGDLRYAITLANGQPDSIVEIAGSATPIVLAAPLPNIANGMTIRSVGPAQTISGNAQWRIFFLDFPGATIRLENLNLIDGRARGGAGGAGGGGGGLGAGGAVFVNAGLVTFDRVTFAGHAVQGGNGGPGGTPANSLAGAGGGGLGGDGGPGSTNGGAGGGGGYYGAGGGPGSGGGGGGGGLLGRGGAGAGAAGLGSGGGGGALTDGDDASPAAGGIGGAVGGGAGQSAGAAGGGQPGAANGGGGGGGSQTGAASAPGGDGGRFGGGGGGWYQSGFSPSIAGAGGEFGGGGGNPHPQGSAGPGGWGGGGGSAAGVALLGQAGTPGQGGYGGGGGGGALGAPAAGGTFAGRGGVSNSAQVLAGGGGGAALGGNVFVRPGSGAVVTFIDCPLPPAALTAGTPGSTDPSASSGSAAQAGSAAGSSVLFGGTTLTLRGVGTVTLAGDVLDDPVFPGSFVKTDDGTLIVTGSISPTGGTSILGGTLQLGTGGTSGSLAGGPVVAHGRLVVNRSDALTLASTISGNGSLTKLGTGTLVLTGDNTYLGATTVSAGTLQIGNNGTSGRIVERLVNQSTVVFQRSDDLTYAGDITGPGTLRKEGPGTLTLSGANTSYSGPTIVNGGVLSVNADRRYGLGGSLTLNGGSLRYTGASDSPQRGLVLGAAGGVVEITNAGTTYTYLGSTSGSGTLTKRGPGTLVLGQPTSNTIGALLVEAGVFRGTGALNSSGTTTVQASIQYAAPNRAWTSSGDLEIGSPAGATFEVSGGTANFANIRLGRPGLGGTIRLLGGPSGAPTLRASASVIAGLDGPGGQGIVSIQQGRLAATGDLILGRDAGSSGRIIALNGSASGRTIVIGQAGSGLVVLNSGGLSTTDGLTLGASGTASGTLTIGADAGQAPLPGGSITGTITGGAGTGGNLLQVNSTTPVNLGTSVSGNLTVRLNAGQVTVGTLSPAGGTFLQGGSLLVNSIGTPIQNNTVIGFNSFAANTSSPGAISGSGRVEKLNAAVTLTLGDNSYTGSTAIIGGTLVLAGASNSNEFNLQGDGSVLELNVASGIRDLSYAVFRFGLGTQTLRKTGAGAVRWPNGFKIALNGLISVDAGEFIGGGFPGCNWADNRAALTVAAGAVFRGADANVYVGALNGGGTITTGSASASYEGLTSGTLSAALFSGVITDTGAGNPGRFIKAGSATQTLTGANLYTGGTVIAGGTLQIGNGGTAGSILGNVINRGTLAFRRSDSLVFPGNITGTGATSHSGGTLTLSGSSTATGTLSVQTGRVVLSGLYAGGFNVAGGGRLSLAGGSVGTPGASSVVSPNGLVDGSGSIVGAVQNQGTIAVGPGQAITVRDGVVSNLAGGTLRALGGGLLDLSGATSLSNAGLIDRISGTILFPATFTNSGVLLDSSLVRIKTAARTGNTVTVTIDGYTAHSYRLQRSTDLAGTTFVSLGAPQNGATGGTLTFTDPAASEAQVFYRVAVD